MPEPGWDEWDVGGGGGYAEFGYMLNENGRPCTTATAPATTWSTCSRGRPRLHHHRRGDEAAVHARGRHLRAARPVHAAAPLRRDAEGRAVPEDRGVGRDGEERPKWLRGHARCGRARRRRSRRTGSGGEADLAVDDLLANVQSRGGRRRRERHLRRVLLRQRPAHGRVPADARQGDRVRHGHPRAARGRRPRRPRRDHLRRADLEHRPRADVPRPPGSAWTRGGRHEPRERLARPRSDRLAAGRADRAPPPAGRAGRPGPAERPLRRSAAATRRCGRRTRCT